MINVNYYCPNVDPLLTFTQEARASTVDKDKGSKAGKVKFYTRHNARKPSKGLQESCFPIKPNIMFVSKIVLFLITKKQKQNEKPTPSSVPAQAKASEGANKRNFTGARPSGKTPHKTEKASSEARSSERRPKISPYNEFVWMKLRKSFAYTEFQDGGKGILRGSIWLDGEVTSVGGTDKVPVFDCTFGIRYKKYYKVVTVNGAEGLETIKKWNRFFRESLEEEPPAAPFHTTRSRQARKTPETPAPAPTSAPSPASAPAASHPFPFPSGEGILSSFCRVHLTGIVQSN